MWLNVVWFSTYKVIARISIARCCCKISMSVYGTPKTAFTLFRPTFNMSVNHQFWTSIRTDTPSGHLIWVDLISSHLKLTSMPSYCIGGFKMSDFSKNITDQEKCLGHQITSYGQNGKLVNFSWWHHLVNHENIYL